MRAIRRALDHHAESLGDPYDGAQRLAARLQAARVGQLDRGAP
jgi:hypothetical protein